MPYLPVEIMFEGSSKLLTEISSEIHWFGISRLEGILSDSPDQKVFTSRLILKRDFSTFLEFSEGKSNLGLKTELELKLLTAEQLSEVFILYLPLFSRKIAFKNAFIEDCSEGFLGFKWLVECDDSFCFLFPLFLAFF